MAPNESTWESKNLEHHCPRCKQPFQHPRGRNCVFAQHVEPCENVHQPLFWFGYAEKCNICAMERQVREQRHRTIFMIIRTINGGIANGTSSQVARKWRKAPKTTVVKALDLLKPTKSRGNDVAESVSELTLDKLREVLYPLDQTELQQSEFSNHHFSQICCRVGSYLVDDLVRNDSNKGSCCQLVDAIRNDLENEIKNFLSFQNRCKDYCAWLYPGIPWEKAKLKLQDSSSVKQFSKLTRSSPTDNNESASWDDDDRAWTDAWQRLEWEWEDDIQTGLDAAGNIDATETVYDSISVRHTEHLKSNERSLILEDLGQSPSVHVSEFCTEDNSPSSVAVPMDPYVDRKGSVGDAKSPEFHNDHLVLEDAGTTPSLNTSDASTGVGSRASGLVSNDLAVDERNPVGTTPVYDYHAPNDTNGLPASRSLSSNSRNRDSTSVSVSHHRPPIRESPLIHSAAPVVSSPVPLWKTRAKYKRDRRNLDKQAEEQVAEDVPALTGWSIDEFARQLETQRERVEADRKAAEAEEERLRQVREEEMKKRRFSSRVTPEEMTRRLLALIKRSESESGIVSILMDCASSRKFAKALTKASDADRRHLQYAMGAMIGSVQYKMLSDDKNGECRHGKDALTSLVALAENLDAYQSWTTGESEPTLNMIDRLEPEIEHGLGKPLLNIYRHLRLLNQLWVCIDNEPERLNQNHITMFRRRVQIALIAARIWEIVGSCENILERDATWYGLWSVVEIEFRPQGMGGLLQHDKSVTFEVYEILKTMIKTGDPLLPAGIVDPDRVVTMQGTTMTMDVYAFEEGVPNESIPMSELGLGFEMHKQGVVS